MEMQESAIDEILEALWCYLEENDKEKWDGLDFGYDNTLRRMAGSGLLILENGQPSFTEQGLERARAIIRRHRLAERLLSDVFDLTMQVAEDDACRFEHLLSPRAEDSVCILLGHPRTCPHGRPIPLGECCRNQSRQVRPLVMPLSRLEKGEACEVAYVGTKDETRLHRLTCLGIIPGHRLKLLQRHPTYVVQVDETHLGLDRSIAEEIYVKTV